MDGISQKTLIDSLNLEFNSENVFSAGEGAGASGSFFFFSYDNKFIIKTLTKEEKAVFSGMIKEYVDHIINSKN